MKNLDTSVQFPHDSQYIVRCTDEAFSNSKSSGNPMITLEFEIAAPESVVVDGEEYNIAGVKAGKFYRSTLKLDKDGNIDEANSAKAYEQIKKLYANFDLPIPSREEMVNPPLGFKGKLVFAEVDASPEEKRKTPTAEQLSKKQKGDVMKHPKTGAPLINYYPKVVQIFCVADGAALGGAQKGPY